MKKVDKFQKFLQQSSVDGWLIYDFSHSNPLAHQVLQLSVDTIYKRRFFYWIPAKGAPVKIVHAIEPHALDDWEGETREYSSWQSLQEILKQTLSEVKVIAMEYSPNNQIPYISLVDAGTVDFIRSLHISVVSSGSFLPYFTAVLDESQIQSHTRAAEKLDVIVNMAWDWIRQKVIAQQEITEYDVATKIMEDFAQNSLVTDSMINVSVNENSANPHYCATKDKAKIIRRGDFLLIDMWAKEKSPNAIFADITRVAVLSSSPSQRQKAVFDIVRLAQKNSYEFVENAFLSNREILGYEVDDVARGLIKDFGFGPFFTHRLGHSITTQLHGSGAHLDNLEMHDTRPILKGSCFSIEPGIYLPNEFGVRLEHDVLVRLDGQVELTGGVQEEILCLL